MTKDFPEADWRRFRDLHTKALDRYCKNVLAEIAAIGAKSDVSAHDRYLETYDLVQQRNEEMARLFDNPRRSTALMQLALIFRRELVSADELAQFSEFTQERVNSLAKL